MTSLTYRVRRQVRKIPLARPVFRWLRDYWDYFLFVCFAKVPLSLGQRVSLLRRLRRVTKNVDCAHTEGELLDVLAGILALPPEVRGSVLEAGCFKGGSTAKFSIVCRDTNR